MLILDNQERSTILAALRFYQQSGMGEPANRSDEIHAIATDNDNDISMDDVGIDGLCEKVNIDSSNPRVLVYVKGGNADCISDVGVEVFVFDQDNVNAGDDTKCPHNFADLAKKFDLPVESEGAA